jgi:hypothetical protein
MAERFYDRHFDGQLGERLHLVGVPLTHINFTIGSPTEVNFNCVTLEVPALKELRDALIELYPITAEPSVAFEAGFNQGQPAAFEVRNRTVVERTKVAEFRLMVDAQAFANMKNAEA